MLYWLTALSDGGDVFNLFNYITVRAGGAFLTALLFGFATNLQYVLSAIGSPVPSEFLLMLPYVVTIVAVAGLAGRVRGPAAAGLPYASR